MTDEHTYYGLNSLAERVAKLEKKLQMGLYAQTGPRTEVRSDRLYGAEPAKPAPKRREVVVGTSHSKLTYYWDAETSKLMVADKGDPRYDFESHHSPQAIRDAAEYIQAWGVDQILAVYDLMQPLPEEDV